MSTGRLTLPIEEGMDDQLSELITRLGADAVRNSDGTWLPPIAASLVDRVYSTYFPARGDQEWALAHPQQATRIFLMSPRVSALTTAPLEIDIMAGYLREQVEPDIQCDTERFWQVIDRTSGRTLAPNEWRINVGAATGHVNRENPEAATSGNSTQTQPDVTVTIHTPTPYHEYTVNFLARQIWDSTQMYNYITNNWQDDPTRVKERPYDVRYPQTWEHVKSQLRTWIEAHPEVNVVRFTTFFYHFTLVFNDNQKEKFVDWFGYSASVSVPAIEEFEREYGYALTPEDFVDAGYYNSPFRPPSQHFRDWIDFQSRFVAGRARELVDIVHEHGDEAIMFLGDNWIGTEPYGPYFPSIGLDAVVGSVGSGATCRMIADIPGVKYTEGRFLPYFFPDVFRPGGDPVAEADASWLTARRAIVRSPLDRMGYGGYLSLAVQFPEFIARVEEIVAEFREIHDRSGGRKPAHTLPRVAVVNAWGKLRSWQTHMVAHALWYKQIYTYLGVIEALAGLPCAVDFVSYQDVIAGLDPDIDVLILAGSGQTAFAGGPQWYGTELPEAVRRFVANGGGIIGVGEPSYAPRQGTTLALADVFGVDRELGWGLSTDRYPQVSEHFITAQLPLGSEENVSSEDAGGAGCDLGNSVRQRLFEPGERCGDVVATSPDTQVAVYAHGSVDIATHNYGAGRAVYLSGCAYSADNSRLLARAIAWAGQGEQQWHESWNSDSPWVEIAEYPETAQMLIMNNSDQEVITEISCGDRVISLVLKPKAAIWRDIND